MGAVFRPFQPHELWNAQSEDKGLCDNTIYWLFHNCQYNQNI